MNTSIYGSALLLLCILMVSDCVVNFLSFKMVLVVSSNSLLYMCPIAFLFQT